MIERIFLATTLLAFSMQPAVAQSRQTDPRWLPFTGCWQPVGDTLAREDASALLCFRPEAEGGGMEMISLEGGEIVGQETLRADGQPREANLEGCIGWERGDFSARPGRVFLSSEHVCDGDVTRTSTGVFAMVASNQWVDVKVVTAGGETLTWVTRYRLARKEETEAAGLGDLSAGHGMAIRSARVAASARPSVEDVIEATDYLEPEGVRTWISERDAPLDLDADGLVRMADAGVSEEVIDMVVAVSYPERFAVDHERERYGQAYGGGYGPAFYPSYGFGYPYGYGYGFGGRGFGPTIARIGSGDSGGRVVKGRGYSRGQGSSATRGRGGSSARGSSIGGSSRGSAGRTSTGRTARRRSGGS